MKVGKLAKDFTARDLANYLEFKAEELGMRSRFTPRPILVRCYDRLLREYEHPELLVMATDHLLSGGFVREVGITERLLTPGVFDVAVSQLGGSNQPWRYLYLKRFAETQDELAYFNFWLGLLDDARAATPGSVVSVSVLGSEFGTWGEVEEEALAMLEKAASTLQERRESRGGLEEVFLRPEAKASETGPGRPPHLRVETVVKRRKRATTGNG
ncbi:hypothetical protein LCGC14_1865740 [marine sediment metagenome]|uniref:Uncharacterized protein n=1 Tax=marine sediment metagenome TaxID=412755 RepID=A0A0F9J563_9ZZZZ